LFLAAAAWTADGSDDMSIEIGLVILAVAIGSQLIPRPLGFDYRLPLVLCAIGLFESFSFLRDHHGGSVLAALAGSLVLAVVSGLVRAPSVRLWIQDGQVWRRGTWLTAVLWVLTLAAHFGYDALVTHGKADVGTATILLYFAVSQAVQRVVLSARAARLPAGGQAAGSATPSDLAWASSGQSASDASGR
jgi:hypothetical protein